MAEVLKLNAAYFPIGIISWQDAMTLICGEKADIIETYDDRYLHTYKEAFNMPAVIRLKHFISPGKDLKFYKPFTRKNVYDRDKGACQYCGTKISLAKMTYDHIVPKGQGGLTIWQNIVCACLKCNSKKNCRTPVEAGMKLLSKPHAPIIADDYHKGMMYRLRAIPKILNNKKWASYIYFNVELDQDKIC
jgi:5-methylcytosine-specific restriction endonuclease McrA